MYFTNKQLGKLILKTENNKTLTSKNDTSYGGA